MNPHQVTADLEAALADYCGSKEAVVTTSCTMAVLLALTWYRRQISPCYRVLCPKYTYVGIPQCIILAGAKIRWTDEEWQSTGYYWLHPTPVIDSARWISSGMYQPGSLMCISGHWTKSWSVGQLGAILLDDADTAEYLRRLRFDGRTPGVAAKDDTFILGYHAYASPRDSAEGLSRLANLPRHNAPLPEPGYTDLSQQEVFKPHTV